MLPLDRLRVHNASARLWRWVVDEIVRAPLEPILHPSTVRLQWLGLFTFGGHFLFAWMWGRLLPQPHEVFSVRVGLAFMGLLLLLNRVNRDLSAKTSVWVFGLIFWMQLPLYFGWMYLMNEGNKVWLASLCSMVLIYYHITDWRLATLGTVTGFGLAAILFQLTRTDQAWLGLDLDNLAVLAFAWVMSIMLGMSGANLRRARLINTLSTMGVMAHELRTPLASVNLMGDVLRGLAQADVPEIKRKKLEELSTRLQNMVRSMNRQIDTQISNAQLLRLPRPTTRIMGFELVQDVVSQYPYRSTGERECVTLELKEDFCFLGSRAQFSQVLVNLIKNALHSLASSSEALQTGALHITVDVSQGRGCLTVADKGTGIPLAKQQRVFEPFFSLQSTVGNGLGLTFCKNVVEAADGHLSLRSEPPHGATFTVTLPIHHHTSAEPSPDTA
ncbi:sensor histidine kinase [Hydrogenophaga sp. A37]|uniref:sensor histidine kinase n=1 Tax=Hydrogenophaga sp. A37 TaxID=1945864 RepID=UPI0009CC0DDF|nr:HAMP domain-containing sensor histidine kinase [Hydrogenophaga sp. A37]OOG84660.1 two-component sensor histidine kinase [Hydrogenophaga sp. A37]